MINKECFKKSLTKDYISILAIAIAIAICLVIAGAVLFGATLITWTAVNTLIVFAAIGLVVACTATLCMSKENAKKGNVEDLLYGYTAFLVVLGFFYSMISRMFTVMRNPAVEGGVNLTSAAATMGAPYPNPLPVLLAFVVIELVVLPLCLAYVRCKEDEPVKTDEVKN